MNTLTSLEDLYENTPSSTAQPSPPDVETPQEVEQQTEQPAAGTPPEPQEEATPGDTPQSTGEPPSPSEDLPTDVKGLQAALKAERLKRQEFGTKVSDYEKQLAERTKKLEEQEALLRRFSQQPQPQPQRQVPQQQHPPHPLDDPEGFAVWQHDQIETALAARDEALLRSRVITSQKTLRRFHDDYDQAEEAFATAAERDPTLWQKLYAHEFPAEFAYEEGKRLMVMQEMGNDPQSYIQSKIDAAIAEALAKQAEAPPPQPQVPTVPTNKGAPPQSLAGVPSTGPRSKPVDAGPVPLEQLYK